MAELGAFSISDVFVGQAGTIYLGLHLLPTGLGSPDFQIAFLEGEGGAIAGRGLIAPPIARTTPRQIVRGGSLCVAAAEAAGDLVLAVNHWGPQVAILRGAGLEPVHSARMPIAWAEPSEHSERPGHWGPMRPEPRAACGERYAVVGYRRLGVIESGQTGVLNAAMVLLDMREFSIAVLGGEAPLEEGSILLMTPGTARGNRFFFFSNALFGYPVVREYRLVRGRADP
jgi:hypothetical protein